MDRIFPADRMSKARPGETAGTLDIAPGSTLQFVGSGLTGGPYAIAQYGSRTGVEFANVVNLPTDCRLRYDDPSYPNAIVLLPPPTGTVIVVR